MSKNSSIGWTHHTFNPWRGCTKATFTDSAGKVHLHPGCQHCYAEVNVGVKMHGIKWGKGQPRVPKAESGWAEPFTWARAAAMAGERHRVFCASLADVLDVEGLPEARDRLWATIRKTACMQLDYPGPVTAPRWESHLRPILGIESGAPGLDWLLLTKRPENWRWIPEDVRPLVWLGTSVSDQQTADEWVPRLLQTNGFRHRFLSVEPLLGPVDLWRSWLAVPEDAHSRGQHVGNKVDWVIVGGESGRKARPCHLNWIRAIVRQCREADVPAFVKQLGACPLYDGNLTLGIPFETKDAKGADMAEWPEGLQVQLFPGQQWEMR